MIKPVPLRWEKVKISCNSSLKPLKKIPTSSRFHQAEAGSWTAQHNPEQKSLVTSLPFSPCMADAKYWGGSRGLQRSSSYENLITALTLVALNKESELKTSITWSGSQSQAGGLHPGKIQKPLSYKLLVPHTHNQQFQPEMWSQNELLEQLGRSHREDECALPKPSAEMKSNICISNGMLISA